VMDHKCAPMAVGIETKLGTRGPFVSNNPQRGCPIELIENAFVLYKLPIAYSMIVGVRYDFGKSYW